MLSSNLYNWFDAEKYCNANHGYLASFETLEESNWVNQYFRISFNYAWFGLNDIGNEGKFTYIDGSKSTLRIFQNGLPDGSTNENCVLFEGSRWNDYSYYGSAKAICKWNETLSSQTAGLK